MSPISPTPGKLTAALGVVPATLLVLLALMVALIALFMGSARRRYAVQIFGHCIDLAAVLIGTPRADDRAHSVAPPLR